MKECVRINDDRLVSETTNDSSTSWTINKSNNASISRQRCHLHYFHTELLYLGVDRRILSDTSNKRGRKLIGEKLLILQKE